MKRKKFFYRFIACLLCFTINVTSNQFSKYLKVKAEINSVSSTSQDSELEQLLYVMPFAAKYIEGLKCIRAIWEVEDISYSEFYVRLDDQLTFELFKNTTDSYVDIEPALFLRHCDMRVIVTLNDGSKLVSEIITLQKNENSFEYVKLDSDQDGLLDGYEIWEIGTDPFNNDTDGDMFNDGYEVYTLGTDPLVFDKNVDSDNDGILNLDEYRNNTHPYLNDTDFDGLNDSIDTNKLIPQSDILNYTFDFNFDIKLGKYDKSFEIENVDGETIYLVINKISKECKYLKINDNEVMFFNDNNNNPIAQVCNIDGQKFANTYSYESGNIVSIGHSDIKYYFNYNLDGNIVETKVGNQIIAKNDYQNNRLIAANFQNGQSIQYSYDSKFDSYTNININGESYYENTYNEKNKIEQYIDNQNNTIYQYNYDDDGELSGIQGNNGFSIQYEDTPYSSSTLYSFDNYNMKENITSSDTTTEIGLSIGGRYSLIVENDVQQNVLMNDNNKNIYQHIIQRAPDNSIEVFDGVNKEIYKFNNNGNLVNKIVNDIEIETYVYDSFGRLIQSDNKELNETVTYKYDINDNIIEECHYNYKESILKYSNIYSYENENWSVLLTSYNNDSIEYDEIGNPIVYRNNMDLFWDQGRLLSEIKTDDNVTQYLYNSEGYRTQKNVNGLITNYLLENSKIIAEETSGDVIWYSYDTNGTPIGFKYNDHNYYYEKNIKNDIIKIYDENGNEIVRYIYDDWGNTIFIIGDDDIGQMNKFRYRSYYFDTESGFYYLQSRYYDCETGRFINADEKLVNYNAYAYCNNNPINYVDYTGHSGTITYYCLAIAFIGFLALAAFFATVNFLDSWRTYFAQDLTNLVAALKNIGSAITVGITQTVHNAADQVSLYIAEKIQAYAADPAYKSTHEIHHIVAQAKLEAKPARDILVGVGINVDDPINLVTIRTGMHKHLHTSIYWNFVNIYVINAHNAGIGREYYAVSQALNQLRMFLLAISAGCPF